MTLVPPLAPPVAPPVPFVRSFGSDPFPPSLEHSHSPFVVLPGDAKTVLGPSEEAPMSYLPTLPYREAKSAAIVYTLPRYST